MATKHVIFIEDFMGMAQTPSNDTARGIKNIISKLRSTASRQNKTVKFTIITPNANCSKELHGNKLEQTLEATVLQQDSIPEDGKTIYLSYVDFENSTEEPDVAAHIARLIMQFTDQIIGEELDSISVLIDLMLREDEKLSKICYSEKELLSLEIYRQIQSINRDNIKVYLYTSQFNSEVVDYVNDKIDSNEYIPVYSRRSFDGTYSYNQVLYNRIMQ